MKNAKFETVYKNAKEWASLKKMDALGFYKSFRNETNLNFGLSLDDTHYEVNQPECVFLKLRGTMSAKEMCRQFYRMQELTTQI